MVDKTKLKVWEVPFSTQVTGSILCLAETPEEAIAYLERKGEDTSLGWDQNNLAEEGILHDGSITFQDIKGGDFEGDTPKLREDLKPEDHNDWEAFDDEGSDDEAESQQDNKG